MAEAFSPPPLQGFRSKSSEVRPLDIWLGIGLNLSADAVVLYFWGQHRIVFWATLLKAGAEIARMFVMAFSSKERRWPIQGLYNIRISYPIALITGWAVAGVLIPGYSFFILLFLACLIGAYNLIVLRSQYLSVFIGLFIVAVYVKDCIALPFGLVVLAEGIISATGIIMYFRLERTLEEFRKGILDQADSLRFLSLYDKITGLPNRDLVMDRLRQLVGKSRRDQGTFALIFFDIDDFSRHNEDLGQAGADALLSQIAGRVAAVIRTSDTLSRWNGDRFALLAGELGGEGQTLRLCEKVRGTFQEPFRIDGREISVTASLGASDFPRDAADEKGLVAASEKALGFAKRNKPMGLSLFDPALEQKIRERQAMETALRKALDGGEFLLHYQPKYTAEKHLDSMEILLRWKSASFGMVSPVVFIPLLEQSGLIREVGHWIFVEAARQMNAWRNEGKTLVPLAINVSVQQCMDPAFAPRTMDFVRSSGLAPHLFEVELTESLFADRAETIMGVLTAFRDIGMHSAVDDFGTGYSSLVRLAELPIDVIKIDKAFVDKIGVNRDTETIIRLILQMAQALGRRTVAEGVEERHQVDFLAALGCPLFQGYYFSKPLPAMEAGRILQNV